MIGHFACLLPSLLSFLHARSVTTSCQRLCQLPRLPSPSPGSVITVIPLPFTIRLTKQALPASLERGSSRPAPRAQDIRLLEAPFHRAAPLPKKAGGSPVLMGAPARSSRTFRRRPLPSPALPYHSSNVVLIPAALALLAGLDAHTALVSTLDVCPCYCPAQDMPSPPLCSIAFQFLRALAEKPLPSGTYPSSYSEFQRLLAIQYL